MESNEVTTQSIGQKIKLALVEASSDGLKRTQRWLALQTGMSEVYLSNKISGVDSFKEDELKKINEVLGTNF